MPKLGVLTLLNLSYRAEAIPMYSFIKHNHASLMIFTQGQFWPPGIVVACVCVCVYQSFACPHDNSSPVQARVTRFGREKQNTLVKIPIVFGVN